MGEWDRRDSGTGWTVSPTFLALIAVVLGLAVLMVARPDFSRWAVFPFVLAGWVVSLCLHEFGHALAAFVCGDRSVRDKGYLTLDPLHYTDLQFSIILPLVFLAMGGIRLPGGAVYVNVQAMSPLLCRLLSVAVPVEQ